MRRKIGTLVLVVGILVLIYPLYQRGMAEYYQYQMSRQLEESQEPALEEGEENPVLQRSDKLVARAESRAPDNPPDNMKISIPALDLEAVVAPGTDAEVLARGPGFYEDTPLPWDEGGNVAIAGHRTTYGAWFRHVDQLEEGDLIRLSGNGHRYEYLVEEVFPVASNDWSVVEPTGYNALTLTTCHPPGSAAERLVVRARMEE